VKNNVACFACGLVFALGLGLSGMTQPTKIIGFLDVTGAWDPSLAFVMVGAIGVHFVFVRVARRTREPLFGGAFAWPSKTAVDGRLIAGAALFGVGWGIAGYCPGPAVVSAASLGAGALVFVAAMAAGMFAAARLLRS
jgi:uncharacterized membrane protein YedE/YeeE